VGTQLPQRRCIALRPGRIGFGDYLICIGAYDRECVAAVAIVGDLGGPVLPTCIGRAGDQARADHQPRDCTDARPRSATDMRRREFITLLAGAALAPTLEGRAAADYGLAATSNQVPSWSPSTEGATSQEHRT
jgi:hypothetical protein